MAKKHFGKFMAFAAIAGTAAAGISYFLRYKSFHKELDEDFHDFEDDFDEDLKDFGDTKEAEPPFPRNYVPLGTDRQASGQGLEDSADLGPASGGQEETSDGSARTESADHTEDENRPEEESQTAAGTAADTVAESVKPVDEAVIPAQTGAPENQEAPLPKPDPPATTIIEDTTE